MKRELESPYKRFLFRAGFALPFIIWFLGYLYCTNVELACKTKHEEEQERERKASKTNYSFSLINVKAEPDKYSAGKQAQEREPCSFPCDVFHRSREDAVAFFTFVLVGVVWYQVLFMLRQEDWLRRTWKVGAKANTISENAATAQLRAYVGIDDIFYQYTSAPGAPHDRSNIDIPNRIAKPRPRLRVINYGDTPARGMVIRSWSTMATIDEEFEFIYRKRNHQVPSQVLDPTQPFGTSIAVDFTLDQFSPLRPLNSGTKLLFIYGSIVYGDIYDRWWFRHFCYYYDPVHIDDRGRLNRFIPHRRYNDEEAKPYKSADAALDTLKWSEAPYNP